jgi:hypothetical protein
MENGLAYRASDLSDDDSARRSAKPEAKNPATNN